MAYLIDANVFIQAKNLHFGFDFCPAFWDWLTTGNRVSKLFSIEKVGDELKAGDDQLEEWAKARGASFFVPPDKPVVGALATVSMCVRVHPVEGQGDEPVRDAASRARAIRAGTGDQAIRTMTLTIEQAYERPNREDRRG